MSSLVAAVHGFRGTQIRESQTGPLIVSHRQKICVINGPDKGLEKELVGTRVAIGTSDDNEIVLHDSTVSRRHCEITVVSDRYVLRDLDSTNGTWIDGAEVKEAFLAPGSRLRVGDTELIFEPKKKWEAIHDFEGDHFGELYGRSKAMRDVFALLTKVASTDLSCVLHGETGSGKELAARGLHQASSRAQKPFVVVDCGAISESLIESELFGHERGAFTGADRQRAGAFEVANQGTVFLDEIGELPIELQPKLLRALERREVKRLGATQSIHVDIRVVAATHRDLPAMVQAKTFREDLYFRLAEVVVKLPPLATRLDDIGLLVERMVQEEVKRGSKVKQVHPDVIELLCARRWPGNVRELRNVVRRAVSFASGVVLTVEDLKTSGGMQNLVPTAFSNDPPTQPILDVSSLSGAQSPVNELPLKDAREQWMSNMERDYVEQLLQRFKWDLDLASQHAGVHRKSLERLMRQYGIKRPGK